MQTDARLCQIPANRSRISARAGNECESIRLDEPLPRVGSWPASLQADVRAALRDAFRARRGQLRPSQTIAGQLDAVLLLIAFAREIENVRPAGSSAERAGQAKSELYAIRAELEARDAAEARIWSTAAAQSFHTSESVDKKVVEQHPRRGDRKLGSSPHRDVAPDP